MDNIEQFDAIIVGSGQAGNPMAIKLAHNDWKVAIVEKGSFGGTCVNDGCTPTKTYVASAKKMHDCMQADRWGIRWNGPPMLDIKSVKARKNTLVMQSVQNIQKKLSENPNITVIRGIAKFTEPYVLQVDGRLLTAPKIFLNVGARAAIPDGFDHPKCLTHKEMLELETIPPHLVVIGGSYIGLEFAQMFRRFGSEVTVVEKESRILSKEDKQVTEAIQGILEKEGIQFQLASDCIGVSGLDGDVKVSISCDNDSQEVVGSHVLVAVGRTPNTDLLDLDEAGVKTDNKGFIQVDQNLETNVKGIYALGDCNGEGAFTHTAYHDYQIVSSGLFEKKPKQLKDRISTYAMFIDPPLARAGINLSDAKKEKMEVLQGFLPMEKVARAKEKGETDGFISILVDAASERIIGATVLGIGADEIISGILNVMNAGLDISAIRETVYPHPTVSELLPSVLENLKPIE
jgi:pyruvate/2-oxoglutarate dehydrogenase complex dihydrolipoamide dehydrogenase (E3) component